LLVPIGALMICFLRNVIGFPTFGIFMPVLMALAFRSTGLFYGLAIFAGVVFIGYLVRSRINDLRLLLVPRLAAILTLVVICFLILSLIGNKWGLRNMMAVGLLPFVILTMTIERFYVLIEESGVKEALITAAGSAAVAILTYGVLQLEGLQLLFFVYPELLLAVAAFQIMLGRYTGYRLSEYIRFRAFKE
ncbi:MAG: 7TM domain-containing protein, partial [Syntrophales bacterium]